MQDIRRIINEFKAELGKLYGDSLVKIIIYGSHARDEAHQGSDIDVLVVLKGTVVPGKEIDRMIDIISDINLTHSVLISVYPVSEWDYENVRSPLLLNVRQEGILA